MTSIEEKTDGKVRIIHSDNGHNRMWHNRIGKSKVLIHLSDDFVENVDVHGMAKLINNFVVDNYVYIERYRITVCGGEWHYYINPMLCCYSEVDAIAIKLGMDCE